MKTFAAWCSIALVLTASDVTAQETICDPENPACGESLDPDLSEEPLVEELEQQASSDSFQNVQFLGRWGTRLDVDTAFDGGDEDVVELSSDLDLGLEWDATDRFRVVASGRFRHWIGGKENPDEVDLLLNASDTRAAYDATVGETYVLWRTASTSFALGNLVTRWGSTDLTRPGDVINPVDRSTISALAAPERLPQLSADLTFSGSGWSLQALLVPFFVPDRVWAFGRDASLFTSRNPVIREQFPVDGLLGRVVDPSIEDDVQSVVSATRVPDEVPANASVGLRGTWTVANTDLGLGAWYGWDRTPFIVVDEDVRTLVATVLDDGQVLEDFDLLGFFTRNPELIQVTDRISEKAAAGGELFQSEFHRQAMLLFDGARYIGPIGVRTDVAFFPAKTYLTEGLQSVRRPTVAAALGVSWERIRSDDDVVTVTLEGFVNHPFDSTDSVTTLFVEEELRGSGDDTLLLVEGGVIGAAGAVMWRIPVLDVSLRLGGVYNVSHGDVIATAVATRRFFDLFDAAVGATIFAGPPPDERLSIGGIYDHNDHVSVAVGSVF